ncbi:hypothetical protein A3L09_07595 [Thermococcus profundus]|uniref:Uncharacterized protein n=1 Tax=Thermococcus profundus TaxID=49899 RepID=A0A2Z2MEN8_THEPR|nr:hypothetical protein [Thermococcus profundus]ASJ03125.1 hypothetical protein A3L09_07595 [Thermococcus profundus]
MRFGELKVTAAVLAIQGLLALYTAQSYPRVYLPFAALDFLLAYLVYTKSNTAVKVALIYLGIDLFLAIFYLIAGVLLKGVVAFLDFLAIHDMVSYIELTFGEEEASEGNG